MSLERPLLSRNTLMATGLLSAVVACGFGGMLLAKHFHGADTPVEASTVSPLAAVPRTATAPLPRPSPATSALPARTDAAVGTSTAAMPPKGSPGYITEDKEVGLVLHRWQSALLSNDAARIAPSYAQKVQRYFLQSNVNRAYVREYMQTEEETGSRLTGYNLKDVSIDHVSGDEVDVRFVADFHVMSPWRETSGGARTLLKLRREDGDWKIFYERDFNS